MNAVSATTKTTSTMCWAPERPQSSLIHLGCRNENRDKADPCHQKEREDQRLIAVDHDGSSLHTARLMPRSYERDTVAYEYREGKSAGM
jgi:hypothetical protein